MTKNKLSFLQMLLPCLLALTIINVTRSPAYSNQSDSSRIRFIEPTLNKKPANRGAPKDRKGAGTRSEECPATKPDFTALVPLMQIGEKPDPQKITDPSSKSGLGLTTLEYPTFWFYVPHTSGKINSLKFVLLDEAKNPMTKEPIRVDIPQKPGTIGIKLSKTAKPLEIGKYYHWYFLVDCNPRSISEDMAIEGFVKRIPLQPNLKQELEGATPQQKAKIYARAGIWQDAIAILAKLRRNKPQNTLFLNDWKDLLQSVDLDEIANEPIQDCCSNAKHISSK
ncbi:MAG: DUF928 domain-containing protein [Mastigocoleus sp. MO_167.B18]|nr:DUF928 domain-containing protein [Mastigocoleus sp. MO_167.B18]